MYAEKMQHATQNRVGDGQQRSSKVTDHQCSVPTSGATGQSSDAVTGGVWHCIGAYIIGAYTGANRGCGWGNGGGYGRLR